MAQLWHLGSPGLWQAQTLPPELEAVALAPGLPAASRDSAMTAGAAGPNSPLLLAADAEGPPRWAVLSPCGIRVKINGDTLRCGIRMLRDKDEIVAGGARFFFSVESLAEVIPFPGSDPARRVFCARCKGDLKAGVPSVRCPGCGSWHHQDEGGELPCWTYAAPCALCAQPTAFDAGFQWTPEDL